MKSLVDSKLTRRIIARKAEVERAATKGIDILPSVNGPYAYKDGKHLGRQESSAYKEATAPARPSTTKGSYTTFTTASGTVIEVTVSERRRYGSQTYTWLYCKVGNAESEYMGDPWPMINPPKSALLWQLRSLGNDITPSPCDVKWARNAMSEKRFVCIADADIALHLLVQKI